MKYSRLGASGLQVSGICLGCASFGEPRRGAHDWTLDEAASRPILKAALEAGVNFFDTANIYSDGTSEEILGRALGDFARRDEMVIATKCGGAWRKGPNAHGLSRKAIFAAIDDSLRRLNTDYVDLYQIHRWDRSTPIEETLEALHDVVQAGKARYVGASSMFAWQFAKALYVADLNGWTRFVSMQNHLNLLNREEEREMLPLCRDQCVGVIPWSPLARGRLTRDRETETTRSETDFYGQTLYRDLVEADKKVVAAVAAVASARELPRAQIALAWVRSVPGVTAPVVGVTKLEHLQDALCALEVQLLPEERLRLEAPYVPHKVAGFH